MGKTTKMEFVSISELKPYDRNAKLHGEAQLAKLCESIREFGFVSPILIDEEKNIIAGHGRIMAAKEIGMAEVPAVFVEGLTDEQRRAYIIADNRLTELGGWDEDLLKEELDQLQKEGFNIDLTGFNIDDEIEPIKNEEEAAEVNFAEALPESRVLVCSVSAFGTSSEKILAIRLPQTTADVFLQKIREEGAGEIVQRLLGALS